MRKPAASRISFVVFLFAIGVFMVACEEKKINEILADPHRYSRREVGVVGEVTQSFSVMGRGAYQIDDGTGRLWVVSGRGVPRKGARVGVKGKVKDGFDFGSLFKLPDIVGNGLVLVESSHRAK